MVIYYDTNGNIRQAEHNTDKLLFSEDTYTLDEIIAEYEAEGIKIATLDMELGDKIFDYKVITDEEGEFESLYPREVMGN